VKDAPYAPTANMISKRITVTSIISLPHGPEVYKFNNGGEGERFHN